MQRLLRALPFRGIFVLCLCGLPSLRAQYLGNTASGSTWGGNPTGLNSQVAASSGQPFGLGSAVYGQKGSLAGWQAFRNYREGAMDRGTGRSDLAHLGPVILSLGAYTTVNYDTNVNSSPDAPLADIFVTFGVNLGLYWKATRRNELQLSLGFNYTQYLRYTQYNDSGVNLAPYTGLDYRIYFLDFVLTLYDYPSMTNGGNNDSPALTNSVNFRQLTNRGGLSLLWHPNQLLFLTGFERTDVLSLSNDQFNSQNYTSYSWYGTASYDVTPTTSAGIRLQATATQYTEQILNNSVTTQAGLFYQSRLTDYTNIYLEAGVQTGDFTNTGRQTNEIVYQQDNGFNTNVEGTLGGSNYVQPYFIFSINNRLTRYLTQTLILSRQASGSTVSNYQETNSAGYQLQYRLNRVTTVGFMATYQYGRISRTTDPVPFTNFTGQLNFSFKVMKDTDLGLGWSYFQNNESTFGANYNRQLFTLSLGHTF